MIVAGSLLDLVKLVGLVLGSSMLVLGSQALGVGLGRLSALRSGSVQPELYGREPIPLRHRGTLREAAAALDVTPPAGAGGHLAAR